MMDYFFSFLGLLFVFLVYDHYTREKSEDETEYKPRVRREDFW